MNVRDVNGREISNLDYDQYEALDSALASSLLASVSQAILLELVRLTSSALIWLKLHRL